MFVIFYYKKRSPISGSYLVNTSSKKKAREIFKTQIDEEKERVIEEVVTIKDCCEVYGETEEEFLDGIKIPEKDGYVLIESGT
jgi:predicted nucleic-acid-binding protein